MRVRLLYEMRKLLGLLPLSLEGYRARVDIRNRVIEAESNALRVTAAELAFEDLPRLRVEARCAEWAGADAGFAANAPLFVVTHGSSVRVPLCCTHRTDRRAHWILTLLANDPYPRPLCLVGNDLDSRQAGPCHSLVLHRADELACAATATFRWVDVKHFLHVSSLHEKSRNS